MEFINVDSGMRTVFLGMQRSGNHAIIEWYRSHFDCSVIFQNNIDVYGAVAQVHRTSTPPFQHWIRSYENIDPETLAEWGTDPEAAIDRLLVVLRDPYNWTASMCKRFNGGENKPMIFKTWQETIPTYIRLCDYVRTHPNNWVNYNFWFQAPKYRRQLEERWGLEQNDDTVDKVSDFGGGSSFQAGCRSAQDLKVMDRWRECKDVPEYRDVILAHPEFKDISQELFGFCAEELYR